MLRALRALRLFWTIIGSYALVWVFSRWSGAHVRARRFERAHRRNAERLATGFMELRGVFIKTGQVLSVTGTFLPSPYGEALARLQDKVPARPFAEIRSRLEEAFGPHALDRFGSFERTPVAAASLAFGLPLSTIGFSGATVLVRIHGVDMLGNVGQTVSRQLHIQ